MRKLSALVLVFGGLVVSNSSSRAADPASRPLRVRVSPDPVYAESTPAGQSLACDFVIENDGKVPFDLSAVLAKGYSADGRLLVWMKVDSNGQRPSIETLGPRHVAPAGSLTVFNPFFQIDAAVPVVRLEYEFRFRSPEGTEEHASAVVRPAIFHQRTRLRLPVAGATLWVYDGPGFFSHHRRVDPADRFNRDVLGLHSNAERYAVDLVVVDEKGEAYHGNAGEKKNWVGFGVPIVSPAAGTVTTVENDQPDEMEFDEKLLNHNPQIFAGNFVVLDHGNGEFSSLGHMRRGSVRVKPGQRVRQGEVLGQMGRSGMGSGLIHVHYELKTRSDLFDAEGLPAVFEGFRRIGARRAESGRLEPGWIVVSDPVSGASTR